VNALTDIAANDAAPLDEDVAPAEARMGALGLGTEVGLILLEVVKAQGLALRDAVLAGADAPVSDTQALAQAYAKITRSMRLNLLVEDRLEGGLRDRRRGIEAARAERTQAASKAAADTARVEAHERWRRANAAELDREAEVQDVVEKTINRAHRGDEEEIDRLEREMLELLEEEDGDYEGYGLRPVSETVARLCEALDVDPEWERWSGKDWAIEEAQAGIAGSPYVSRKRGGSGDCVIEVGGADSS
jgi:hypothetical protein